VDLVARDERNRVVGAQPRIVSRGRRAFAVAAAVVAAVVPVAARADGGARAEEITAGFHAVWTTGANGIVRIDPSSGRVIGQIRVNSFGVIPSLATGEGAVWMLTLRRVIRIDPVHNRVVGRVIRLPRLSAAFAVGAGSVWVADYDDSVLRRLDPWTGRLLTAINGVGLHVEAIAATPQAIWVASVGSWTTNSHGEFTPVGDGLVTRIDPRTDRIVARIHVGRGPGTLAVGAGSIWVANFRGLRPDFSVSRIDPRSNRVVATIRLHRLLAGMTVADGYLWAINPGKLLRGGLDMSGGTLIRIDPVSGQVVTRRLPESSRPAAITFAHHHLWIGSPGNGYVLRVDPKTMSQTRIPIPVA
jgi:virginiamycin B lyase